MSARRPPRLAFIFARCAGRARQTVLARVPGVARTMSSPITRKSAAITSGIRRTSHTFEPRSIRVPVYPIPSVASTVAYLVAQWCHACSVPWTHRATRSAIVRILCHFTVGAAHIPHHIFVFAGHTIHTIFMLDAVPVRRIPCVAATAERRVASNTAQRLTPRGTRCALIRTVHTRVCSGLTVQTPHFAYRSRVFACHTVDTQPTANTGFVRPRITEAASTAVWASVSHVTFARS